MKKIAAIFCLVSISLPAFADWSRPEEPSRAYAIRIDGDQAKVIYNSMNVESIEKNGMAIKKLSTSSGLVGVSCSEQSAIVGKNHACLVAYQARNLTQLEQFHETVQEVSMNNLKGRLRQVSVLLSGQESQEICSALQLTQVPKQTSKLSTFRSHGGLRAFGLSVDCNTLDGKFKNGSMESLLSTSREETYGRNIKDPVKSPLRMMNDQITNIHGEFSFYN